MTGPRIDVTPNGEAIAAIETLAVQTPYYQGGCSVGWSVLGLDGYPKPVCPAQPLDAGWIADACAQRYLCAPPGYGRDAGDGCTQAWINLTVSHCAVTVIATTGERRTFEARQSGSATHYSCHPSGMGCIDMEYYSVAPALITLTFAAPDGGQ